MRKQPAPSPTPISGRRPRVDEAEAILVEHYGHLVRLVHLVLPADLGRHRRVVTAHSVVQRTLPRTPGTRGNVSSAQPPADAAAYSWIRDRVLKTALGFERPPWAPLRQWWQRSARLPLILGVRVFPSAGGADELALSQALSGIPAAARAALALHVLEALAEDEIVPVLSAAGVADPRAALRTALSVPNVQDGSAAALLRTGEFDPGLVQLHPTDLLRRRNRARLTAAVLTAAALAAAATLTVGEGAPAPGAVANGPTDRGAPLPALDPAKLRTASAEGWADTARVDFSAWPARGARAGDRALLHRALRAWGSPGEAVRVTATEDTTTAPPIRPPQLLYAGDVNGEAVVLLHDGQRLVRYAEPATDGSAEAREDTAALDFARTDNAGVTTAAAVVIGRTTGGARYLMAPWIAETGTRDLLRPGAPTRRLPAVDGVTAVVPSPATGGACASWPVLSLRSSERIVEKHAFLLTDLGDLTPVHLTHTPPPGSGAPARQPREATGREALVSWARSACTLTAMRGKGARAVNDWVYARQSLPGGGRAAWVCTRMEAWRGAGRVQVRFQPPAAGPAAPATVVAEQGDTAACSRFGQHVVAAAQWRSPQGRWFVLAAGSRSVSRISLSGGVDASSAGPTIAVPAAEGAQVEVTAFHADGSELSPLRGR